MTDLGARRPDWTWPNGARAAVSLTYDDAVPSQRQHAAAQLGQNGLAGTFFLTGTSHDLATHRRDWQRLLAQGHELASHTMHHPCDCAHDWVPKGHAVQDYDLPRMAAELDETVRLLEGLGAPRPYSFAYPCGETRVGEPPQSYSGLVAERFVAARGVQAALAEPWQVDLNEVPAHDGARPIEELLGLVERVEAGGGWLVLLFHGVGGDHLSVELDVHRALLEHLARRRQSVWTERFGAVASYVAARRA